MRQLGERVVAGDGQPCERLELLEWGEVVRPSRPVPWFWSLQLPRVRSTTSRRPRQRRRAAGARMRRVRRSAGGGATGVGLAAPGLGAADACAGPGVAGVIGFACSCIATWRTRARSTSPGVPTGPDWAGTRDGIDLVVACIETPGFARLSWPRPRGRSVASRRPSSGGTGRGRAARRRGRPVVTRASEVVGSVEVEVGAGGSQSAEPLVSASHPTVPSRGRRRTVTAKRLDPRADSDRSPGGRCIAAVLAQQEVRSKGAPSSCSTPSVPRGRMAGGDGEVCGG